MRLQIDMQHTVKSVPCSAKVLNKTAGTSYSSFKPRREPKILHPLGYHSPDKLAKLSDLKNPDKIALKSVRTLG